ncbi:hypothetical protein PPL_12081 [Heterostelium album PN500]|uniref:Uncharacterized protein n=1 Tax=Heterostelium pallidum (strain ATCC 26659 / Pp 5 / PN500) TaxID=670386 RepID=D3BLM8_HETP5|nr:hypothetical protein PPL_12081 [Heterostelium album PN500]EFA77479.1 hypothetical protein PPL_12081 [Heterostelium album PN500]|eukprot:XP_020429607.1 hypothetical protein PPL_12081 [Heterostelium album PN500]
MKVNSNTCMSLIKNDIIQYQDLQTVMLSINLCINDMSLIDKNNIFCYVAVGVFIPILPIVFWSNKLNSENVQKLLTFFMISNLLA